MVEVNCSTEVLREMIRLLNGARTVVIFRCSLVRVIFVSIVVRWVINVFTSLTALAVDCVCNNTVLRFVFAARCVVFVRLIFFVEIKFFFSNGSVRRNVFVVCFAAVRVFFIVVLIESVLNCCALTLRWVSIICLFSVAREVLVFVRLVSYGRGSMRNSKSFCLIVWLSVIVSFIMRSLIFGIILMVFVDA